MKNKVIFVVISFIVIFVLVYSFQEFFFSSTETSLENVSQNEISFEIIVEDLEIPWDLEFLPDNALLITERPGRLVIIGNDKKIIEIEGVQHRGEGGLLGLALDPNFETNNFIYLYFTSNSNGNIENRIERYTFNLNENSINDKVVILSKIPGASYHDGGRISFGPDGYLYVTTGDAGDPDNSQNIDSLAGKILKIDINDFTLETYSYGHRNSQGIAWDGEGNLWATEHGRSGINSGFDEINLIEQTKNYGWPIIQGDEIVEGMESPKAHSGSEETWAPASLAFYDNSLFFGGLRGNSLYEASIENNEIVGIKSYFRGDFGRIREVKVHEGYLYFTTSNRDGRGNVREGDDKIIRVDLNEFNL